jgi:hypothetical protein
MDKINEWLEKTKIVQTCPDGTRYQKIRPRLICKDGYSISVQASWGHYCSPRFDDVNEYKTVELGFPNMKDVLIMAYAEEPDYPTETVYAYVPVELVNELIEKHGGIMEDSK